MSRRRGQKGYIEKSGKWFVVRFRTDKPGQEDRSYVREKICPVSGPGSMSKSERMRRAKEIIAASGADSTEHFEECQKKSHCVTFREQAELWLEYMQTRKRKPIASATIDSWKDCLKNWLYPELADIPLESVNNLAAKHLIAKMVGSGRLKPKSIHNYVQVIKMVVASAVNENGEQLYPRKWNHQFMDLPVVEKNNQNTPSISSEVMTALAAWHNRTGRTLFALCGATGMRIGEALGLEIGKHVSNDFMTLLIRQKARKNRIENRLKTDCSNRDIDLHPSIAAVLKEYVGGRKSGLVFCAHEGKPMSQSSIIKNHLHKALKHVGYVNPFTGTYKAGNHIFRRFRNTYLRNRTACPDGLIKFWMGHAPEDMSGHYDKIKGDVEFRKEVAERCGIGFDLPAIAPNAPNCTEQVEIETVA